jgi:hypothetical protein
VTPPSAFEPVPEGARLIAHHFLPLIAVQDEQVVHLADTNAPDLQIDSFSLDKANIVYDSVTVLRC